MYTAAVPMDKPYCSCKLTRVRSAAATRPLTLVRLTRAGKGPVLCAETLVFPFLNPGAALPSASPMKSLPSTSSPAIAEKPAAEQLSSLEQFPSVKKGTVLEQEGQIEGPPFFGVLLSHSAPTPRRRRQVRSRLAQTLCSRPYRRTSTARSGRPWGRRRHGEAAAHQGKAGLSLRFNSASFFPLNHHLWQGRGLGGGRVFTAVFTGARGLVELRVSGCAGRAGTGGE